MKKNFVLTVFTFLTILSISHSCKKETITTPVVVEEKEFVARNSDFDGYRNWTVLKKTNEKHPNFDASSHLNNNSTLQRWIYVKDNQKPDANGQYPVGTMIVKEYRKLDGTAFDSTNVFYTAMVKRGKKFNPTFGDWEWFHIDPKTLKIRIAGGGVNAEYRGADLFNNSCNNCHNAVKSGDFVFTK
jgi:hypothetical protein